MHLGTDHQHRVRVPSTNQGVGGRDRVYEPGALLAHIHRWDPGQPQFRLQEAGRPRKLVIWGEGGEKNHVDLGRLNGCVCDRRPCRLEPEITGGGTRVDPPSLANPGPLDYPFVRCVHHLSKVVVRNDPLGQVGAESHDA